MNVSGIVGITTAIVLVIATIVANSPLVIFISAPSAVLVVGLALSLQWVILGSSGLIRTLGAFRVLVLEVSTAGLAREEAEMLRGLICRLYAAGAIGTLVTLVQYLGWYDHMGDVAPWMNLAPLALFYATILAECIVRPCANRIEYIMTKGSPQG